MSRLPQSQLELAVQVEARGDKDGLTAPQTYTITGNGQGRATALVAAQVVKQLLTGTFPSGVFHSEQLFEPLPFIHWLAADGIIYHESARPDEGSS